MGQYKIMLPKFVSVRLDRSRHGGGILLWIKDTIVFKVLQSGPQDLELILISIDLPKCKNYVLEFFYRSPATSVALFDSLLDVIYVVNPIQFSQFVLVGDFNVYMMVCSSYHKYIVSFSSHLNFSQVVVD